MCRDISGISVLCRYRCNEKGLRADVNVHIFPDDQVRTAFVLSVVPLNPALFSDLSESPTLVELGERHIYDDDRSAAAALRSSLQRTLNVWILDNRTSNAPP